MVSGTQHIDRIRKNDYTVVSDELTGVKKRSCKNLTDEELTGSYKFVFELNIKTAIIVKLL